MRYFLMLAVLIYGAVAFGYDFDIAKERTCVVTQTTKAPELYHSSEITEGYFARSRKDVSKISLKNLLDDQFIYFTKSADASIEGEYIWRYSGPAQRSIDGPDYSVYATGSVGGPLLMIFQKNDQSLDVIYLKPNGNKTLVSLRCDL